MSIFAENKVSNYLEYGMGSLGTEEGLNINPVLSRVNDLFSIQNINNSYHNTSASSTTLSNTASIGISQITNTNPSFQKFYFNNSNSSVADMGNIVVAQDGYGKLEVFAIGQDNKTWLWRESDNNLTAWHDMGLGSKSLDVVMGADGKLNVFAIGAADNKTWLWRESDNNFTYWYDMGLTAKDPISIQDPISSNPHIFTPQEFANSWWKLPEYTSNNPFPDKGQNCTWYAYGRMKQLGYSSAALNTMLGNAGTWDNTVGNGATVSSIPQVPCIAVWEIGVGGVPTAQEGGVGHVAVVERINYNSNGSIDSIVISESNWLDQQYDTRTISPNDSHWPSEFIIVPKA